RGASARASALRGPGAQGGGKGARAGASRQRDRRACGTARTSAHSVRRRDRPRLGAARRSCPKGGTDSLSVLHRGLSSIQRRGGWGGGEGGGGGAGSRHGGPGGTSIFRLTCSASSTISRSKATG